MKKKIRRKLKGSKQIGNYIWQNGMDITMVFLKNKRIEESKIMFDYDFLVKFCGYDIANEFLQYALIKRY